MSLGTAARSLLGFGLLALAVGAAAQSNTIQAAPQDAEADSGTRNFFFSGSAADQARLDKLMQEHNQRKQELQRRLADPQQRAQVREERIQKVRAQLPDLARVAQLDAASEARLLGLLADQQLAMEMRPNGFAALEPLDLDQPRITADALEHTLLMREIGQQLGLRVVDAYLDYMGYARYRIEVEKLQSALPAAAKLSAQQKDALVKHLSDDAEEREEQRMRSYTPLGFDDFDFTRRQTPQELERRSRIRTIAANEAIAVEHQQAHRELRRRVAPLLSPEQLESFTAQLKADVYRLLAWTQRERRELGIDPKAQLDTPKPPPPPPPPALRRNLRLSLDMQINGKKFVKTVTSVQGAAVTFDGPEGLVLQARPLPMASFQKEDMVMVLVTVFEVVDGQRRPIGQTGGSTTVLDPGQPVALGKSISGTILLGRKGYDVTSSVTAFYE